MQCAFVGVLSRRQKADKKSGLGQLWEQAVSLIIRPQRAQYGTMPPPTLLRRFCVLITCLWLLDIAQLGPSDFHVLGRPFQRIDFSLPNGRGHLLQCSWYRPAAPEAPVPAVIYLHGNSGCRCDADDALHTMLPYGVSGNAHNSFFVSAILTAGRWQCLRLTLAEADRAEGNTFLWDSSKRAT